MSRVKREYNFKSTGRKFGAFVEENQINEDLPLGIRTPISYASSTGDLFEMNVSYKENVKDNLRNLIATNWGERLGEWNFGANLKELIANLEIDNAEELAEERIREAVQAWMPYVQIVNVSANNEDGFDPAQAYFVYKVIYECPDIFSGRDSVEVEISFI
jgi:phage baseplate assembly protein W